MRRFNFKHAALTTDVDSLFLYEFRYQKQKFD